MIELFDKKFVHFMWDDELKGKEGFFADIIDALEQHVNFCDKRFYDTCLKSNSSLFVFNAKNNGRNSQFFYYDPNYEVKKAYNEGKAIQFKDDVSGEWCSAWNPRWDLNIEYRIKPEEEKKWIVYLAREYFKGKDCYLTACTEDNWEGVQKKYRAKTKLFVGTESKVEEWCEDHEKFTQLIKAWEDGKTIQVYEALFNKWSDCAGTLEWYTDCEYRVKPEEEKKYRPYENSAEMIADFIDRFNADCPSYRQPSIWVENKWSGGKFLITGIESSPYDGENVEVQCGIHCVSGLFDTYTYLDGSLVGMEVKE